MLHTFLSWLVLKPSDLHAGACLPEVRMTQLDRGGYARVEGALGSIGSWEALTCGLGNR